MKTLHFFIKSTDADVIGILKKAIDSDNPPYTKQIDSGADTVFILVAEQYFYRINSNLSITAVVCQNADGVWVDLTSSGGADGVLGLTLGAESSALKTARKELSRLGFVKQK